MPSERILQQRQVYPPTVHTVRRPIATVLLIFTPLSLKNSSRTFKNRAAGAAKNNIGNSRAPSVNRREYHHRNH